jgi:hypothetical protein
MRLWFRGGRVERRRRGLPTGFSLGIPLDGGADSLPVYSVILASPTSVTRTLVRSCGAEPVILMTFMPLMPACRDDEYRNGASCGPVQALPAFSIALISDLRVGSFPAACSACTVV